MQTLQTQVVDTTYLPPLPRGDIQDPCILQTDAILVHSPSDQQLGVFLSIVEAASSMGVSPHWPRGYPRILQFGPLLGQVMHKTYIHIQCHMMSSCNDGYHVIPMHIIQY